MPLYEYECAACGERFERLQKFADPPIKTCPACGGHVSRLLSSSAIRFKGSGWYVTDYARPDRIGARGDQHAAEKESADAEKSESGSSQSDKSEAGEKPSKETAHPAKTSKPESGKPGKKKD